MNAAKPIQDNLGQSGQNLIRILIASYFIGISTGLINGTTATPLIATVLPLEQAEFMGSAIVFVLAYLVLTGTCLRAAALLLGLVMFWSSYIANFGAGTPTAVGEFWRDLTLIGALMLTYVKTGPRAVSRRAMLRWTPRVRQVTGDTAIKPRRVENLGKSNVTRLRPPARDDAPAAKPATNIFRDDCVDVLAS